MDKYILLVEDNFVAVVVAKKILAELGCRVDHANDGHIAVELAIKNRYDGIYMDIGLPTMSGLEACIAIRNHETLNPDLSAVPIIAVTANNNEDESQIYKEKGMLDVIFKPFTKEKAIHFLSLCTR